MFKRFKTKINIMGRDIEIIFYKDKEAFSKIIKEFELPEETTGYADYLDHSINIVLITIDDIVDMETAELVLWHEIGHFMERYSVTSTKVGEWTSSLFEFVPPLIPQVNKVLRELKNKVSKNDKKRDT